MAVDVQRWLVLLSFVLHAFMNQFMFMDFAGISSIAEVALSTDEAGLNALYTASMIAAVPAIVCTLALIDSYSWAASFCGVTSTVAAAWIRYMAVLHGSYTLAIISSAALGAGVGIIFVGFTSVPGNYFLAEKERAMAMAVAVQMSFFGWAIGGLCVPMSVTLLSDLCPFTLAQAVVTSFCLLVFIACHKSPPQPSPLQCALLEGGDVRTEESRGKVSTTHILANEIRPGFMESIRCMLRNQAFLTGCVACGLFQGVGFTVPAVQAEVFGADAYSDRDLAWTGFAFIMGGVAMGLSLSQLDTCPKIRRMLVVAFFWTGCSMLWLLQLTVSSGAAIHENLRYEVYLVLMTIAGACSLGFVNAALPMVCEAAFPVPESQSGGVTELMGFVLGAFITQFSTGNEFWVCAGAALLAAVLMTVHCMSQHSSGTDSGSAWSSHKNAIHASALITAPLEAALRQLS